MGMVYSVLIVNIMHKILIVFDRYLAHHVVIRMEGFYYMMKAKRLRFYTSSLLDVIRKL
jgi:hypothetical protein